jgi:hypothetical protein
MWQATTRQLTEPFEILSAIGMLRQSTPVSPPITSQGPPEKRSGLMKFLCVVSVLILVVDVTVVALVQTRSDSDLILAAEQANAPVQRDFETFAKYLSDDYVLIVVNTTPEKKSECKLTPKAKWVEMVRSGCERYDTTEIQQALRRKSHLRSFRTTAGRTGVQRRCWFGRRLLKS